MKLQGVCSGDILSPPSPEPRPTSTMPRLESTVMAEDLVEDGCVRASILGWNADELVTFGAMKVDHCGFPHTTDGRCEDSMAVGFVKAMGIVLERFRSS